MSVKAARNVVELSQIIFFWGGGILEIALVALFTRQPPRPHLITDD